MGGYVKVANRTKQILKDAPYPRVEMAYPKAKPIKQKIDNNQHDLNALYSPRAKYTAEEKLAAVLAYVMTGTVAGVVRLTGFKQQVISDWKNNSSWWPDAYHNVKKQKQEEVDGTLTSIVHAAAGGIMDRIMHGDEVVDKNGDLVRRKMSGKELAWVMGITYDKRALLRGDPTSRSEKVDQTKLIAELKEDFANMAKQHLDKTVINSED
jgi:hypothetical protein